MKETHEPFGQADCESEVKTLKSEYSKLYFDEAPFNAAAIKPETYLVIGRRGSGKTALAHYFSFQKAINNPIYIDVDEPTAYQEVLTEISTQASQSREIVIPRIKKIWEYVIWCIIFERAKERSAQIAKACVIHASGSVSQLINNIIERLLEVFCETDDKGVQVHIDQFLKGINFEGAKAAVLQLSGHCPVIIAVDTLEKYDVNNNALMNAMAALIQCAADFNLRYRERGIHLKVFMSGEVFPYLEEEVIQNPLKSVKDPVYLLWRPKDLLRLISWRFYCFLEETKLLRQESKGKIDWENHHEVMVKMWQPYFGQEVTNGRGLKERTFSYVLRHTQMRPRQLILTCNEIMQKAMEAKRFPQCSEEDIRSGVKSAERYLANEILNSFSSIYPSISTIVEALVKIEMIFTGNELDKRARQSAPEWPRGTYSPAKFRRLVAELGVIGRVRRRNDHAGYIDADFEYSLRERLPITHRDECVIHPMFYDKFSVRFNAPSRVMPFSTEREVREADGDFS